eukprot:7175568-Alexandrium_andersonii.AAC.1
MVASKLSWAPRVPRQVDPDTHLQLLQAYIVSVQFLGDAAPRSAGISRRSVGLAPIPGSSWITEP